MARQPRVHAFVMAGGSGSRLQPLTLDHCKPALPFGGRHRVIDFVLGNLWHSQILSVDLLVQYRPASLISHVRETWPVSYRGRRPFVRIAAPPAGAGYRGTADAVRQNLQALAAADDDLVLIFGADHVYRMDVRHMIEFHASRRADITVATLPVPLAHATGFGIVQTHGDGTIAAFHEKPAHPPAMPGRPGHALASMGNYIFTYGVLRRELERAAAAGQTDFGAHVLPNAIRTHRVLAWNFHDHAMAVREGHEEKGYWRDVGTLDAYLAAHMDTLGPCPVFPLHSDSWPLNRANAEQPPLLTRCDVRDSRVGSGASVDRACLDHAVLGDRVRVGRGAHVRRSVLFDGVIVGAGARLRNVIVDEGNVIPAGEVIGEDPARDRARFSVSEGGVVVVPRRHFPAPAAWPLLNTSSLVPWQQPGLRPVGAG